MSTDVEKRGDTIKKDSKESWQNACDSNLETLYFKWKRNDFGEKPICIPGALRNERDEISNQPSKNLDDSLSARKKDVLKRYEADQTLLNAFYDSKVGGIVISGFKMDSSWKSFLARRTTISDEFAAKFIVNLCKEAFEVDCLLIHPDLGIFIIETKGIGSEKLVKPKTVRKKFKTAKEQLERIGKNIKEVFQKITKSPCNIDMNLVVCFPNIMKKSYFSDIDQWDILDQKDLNDQDSFHNYWKKKRQQAAPDKLNRNRSIYSSDESFRRFLALLIGLRTAKMFSPVSNAVETQRALSSPENSKHLNYALNLQDRTKKTASDKCPQISKQNSLASMIFLNSLQLTAYETAQVSRNVIILGPPGTGKTLLLMYLSLCAAEKHGPGRVVVFAPHPLSALYGKFYNANAKRRKRSFLVIGEREAFVSEYEKCGPLDDIFVDESDLSWFPERSRSKTAITIICISINRFCDPKQRSKIQEKEREDYRIVRLASIMRNTAEIVNFINKKSLPNYSDDDYFTCGHNIKGINVKELEAYNIDRACKTITHNIRSLLIKPADNHWTVKPSDIAIIVADVTRSDDIARIKAYMASNGVPTCSLAEQVSGTVENQADKNSAKVAVESSDSIRSMEWSFVFVIASWNCSEPTSVVEQPIALLSRAIFSLTIINTADDCASYGGLIGLAKQNSRLFAESSSRISAPTFLQICENFPVSKLKENEFKQIVTYCQGKQIITNADAWIIKAKKTTDDGFYNLATCVSLGGEFAQYNLLEAMHLFCPNLTTQSAAAKQSLQIDDHASSSSRYLKNDSKICQMQNSLKRFYTDEFHLIQPFSLDFSFDIVAAWITLFMDDRLFLSRNGEHLEVFEKYFRNNDKFMLIEGAVASGKTTLTKRLAFEWATGKNSSYDFVFFAEFRHVQNRHFDSISDLLLEAIKNQLSNDELRLLRNLILEENFFNQCKILILLDGYDEMYPQHQCKEINNELTSTAHKDMIFDLIVTTRPGFATYSPVKRAVIDGFLSTEQKYAYIDNHFFFKTNARFKSESVRKILENDKNLKTLSTQPFFLSLICFLSEATDTISVDDICTIAIWLLFDRWQKGRPEHYLPFEFELEGFNIDAFQPIKCNFLEFPALISLGRMAFELKEQTVFYEEEIKKYKIPSSVFSAGLLVREEKCYAYEAQFRVTYVFLHDILREFLASKVYAPKMGTGKVIPTPSSSMSKLFENLPSNSPCDRWQRIFVFNLFIFLYAVSLLTLSMSSGYRIKNFVDLFASNISVYDLEQDKTPAHFAAIKKHFWVIIGQVIFSFLLLCFTIFSQVLLLLKKDRREIKLLITIMQLFIGAGLVVIALLIIFNYSLANVVQAILQEEIFDQKNVIAQRTVERKYSCCIKNTVERNYADRSCPAGIKPDCSVMVTDQLQIGLLTYFTIVAVGSSLLILSLRMRRMKNQVKRQERNLNVELPLVESLLPERSESPVIEHCVTATPFNSQIDETIFPAFESMSQNTETSAWNSTTEFPCVDRHLTERPEPPVKEYCVTATPFNSHVEDMIIPDSTKATLAQETTNRRADPNAWKMYRNGVEPSVLALALINLHEKEKTQFLPLKKMNSEKEIFVRNSLSRQNSF